MEAVRWITATALRYGLRRTESGTRRRRTTQSENLPRSHPSRPTAQLSSLTLIHSATPHTDTRLTALCPGLYPGEPYQKGKISLDSTEARDIEWQWHQLDHMLVCTLLQTDNHASTQLLSFFTIQYDTRCYFNVRSKADISQLNLPHGTDN